MRIISENSDKNRIKGKSNWIKISNLKELMAWRDCKALKERKKVVFPTHRETKDQFVEMHEKQ